MSNNQIGITKYTEQYIQNKTFDDDFSVIAVENLEYDPQGTLVRKVNDPTEGYGLVGIDIGADPIYVGYQKTDASWFIKKIYLDGKTVTYSKGASNYAANWTNRAALTYQDFDTTWS